MHVDAKDIPRSLTLAIVVTLASVALWSFSLRLYTRGRLLRSLGIDDGLLIVAALCIIGVLVITAVPKGNSEKQAWPTRADDDHTTSVLVWIVALLHILGIGFVKLSVALTMLKLALQNWYRNITLALISLTTVVTVLWFGCALLFRGPTMVNWSFTDEPEAIWRLLDFINSVLDVVSSTLVVLLSLPLLRKLRPSFSVTLALLVVYTSATAAVAIAIVRTYSLHKVWRKKELDELVSSIVLWSFTELTLGMLAASSFTLKPLASSVNQCLRNRRRKHLSASSGSSPNRYPSQMYASTDTVIHRPNAPHLLSLRFHDDESNLDFDIETPNNRSQTHIPRSRGTHSRNVSDWSQFSGFTYYTTTANSVQEASPRRSRAVSMHEIELRTRNIGAGRSRAGDTDIGVAVTTLHDKPVRDSEVGEETADLAKLFANKSKDSGTETSHSVRTSAKTDSMRVSQ